MSEASYTAWDDNLYAWPPPEGWYQASDGRWWPAGYGPAVQQHAPGAPSEGSAPPDQGGLDPYDQRTSAIPAGGLAAAAAASGPGPSERVEAESRRRVFDELPPIDDVFGGIDPYADDEEAMASAGPDERDDSGGSAVTPGPSPTGSGNVDAPDHGYLLLGPVDPGSAAPDPANGSANGSLAGSPAVPPPPSSLLGDPGRDNGSPPAADRPSAFDGAATVYAPSSPPPPPPRPEAAPAEDDPTGPMAGRPASPPDPPPTAPVTGGPGRSPADDWATATTILPRDDDGATRELDLDALREADRTAAPYRPDDAPRPDDRRPEAPWGDDRRADDRRGDRRAEVWGPEADWADDDQAQDRRRPADREPALAGVGDAAFHRELTGGPGGDPALRSGGYGDYGDIPVGAAPAPRRWWPLVAIGLAVLVAAASIGGYLLLRDDSQSSATEGGDPAADGPPGSFSSPYPFGKVVVVYYNDEATKEQRRWVIQVLAPVADATQQLVGAGTAAAPGQGEVLALTRVRVTYQSGPEPGSLSDLRFKAVGGAPGTVFDESVACPAAAPLDPAAQVKVLDSAEGDLCWRIPQGELATLKLAVEAEAADGTVHMELNAPAGG